MKKKSNEFNRIQKTISYDSVGQRENFETLLDIDLKKLLTDYFNIKDDLRINVSKINGQIDVSINFVAYSMKGFSSLPKNI